MRSLSPPVHHHYTPASASLDTESGDSDSGQKHSLTLPQKVSSNKEGDSVSPSGYRLITTTSSQTPSATPPPTRSHGRAAKYPPTTTATPPPLISAPPPPSPTTRPSHAAPTVAGTTPRTPPWSRSTPAATYRPRRPWSNDTLAKSPQDKLWLEEKLETDSDGNQVFKRPRGRGLKRGRRLRAGALRLVSADGLPDRGRVEIFIRGQWGTVCDDLFNSRAGEVVCRQLGFSEALAVMKRAALGEADASVRILLDDVLCQGGERSLLECKRSRVGKHNCSHREDVGVICG